jgi:hypothetical protein
MVTKYFFFVESKITAFILAGNKGWSATFWLGGGGKSPKLYEPPLPNLVQELGLSVK